MHVFPIYDAYGVFPTLRRNFGSKSLWKCILWPLEWPSNINDQISRKCEPELSYILAKLLNKCLKESCFPDCWKVSSVVPVFKNVGERSTAKNLLVFFLWLVKSLKNL